MAEYIDREALIKQAIEEKRFVFKMEDAIRQEVVFKTVYKDFADLVMSIPAADVEEVKHGRWVKDPHTADVCAEYRCSLCGYTYCEADPKQPPFKYCPECGAKNE